MPSRPGSRVPTPPTSLPAVHLARDHVRQDVAARLRAQEWRRAGRGAYVSAALLSDVRATAVARIIGVHHQLRAPHVFSHVSAAVLWGLPLWSVPAEVHVYQACRPGSRRDPSVRRHLGALDTAMVSAVRGLPVTTLARTAVDCARSMSPLAGLVVMDGTLRAGVRPEELVALTRHDPTGRGMVRAREVIDLGDPGAESPQESALRFVVLRSGLPRPETQVRIETRLGTFWGDVGWERWRTVLEYDGRPKYTSNEVLVQEKRRHDALVDAGWRILRVTKEDLRTAGALVMRVRSLLPPDIPLVRRPHLNAR